MKWHNGKIPFTKHARGYQGTVQSVIMLTTQLESVSQVAIQQLGMWVKILLNYVKPHAQQDLHIGVWEFV